jgi:archaellum component FlaC
MGVLRSLMIELGLSDDVSNKLRGIDTQINGIESGLIDTQSGFDDLGRATTEYGRVAGKEIEGVEDDIDELDKQVEEHADITKKATKEAAESWGNSVRRSAQQRSRRKPTSGRSRTCTLPPTRSRTSPTWIGGR